MSESVDLANELKTLRKGRGLQAPRLADQVGPLLHDLADISPNDSVATIREKLSRRLRILADSLPDDLRQVVTIALALQHDTQHQFLQERVQFLADKQKRDVRTIRRRMDEGFELLAEMATKPSGAKAGRAGLGWYIDRMEAILRVDKGSPEVFERRRITSEWDGLDTIKAAITVPRHGADAAEPHGLDTELYFGATMVASRQPREHRFDYDFRLPRPLAIGEKHEYGIVQRIPPDQLMRSHYVFFPDRRCEEFALRIRFSLDNLPRLIWRVAEVFHRDVDDNRPTTDILVVDDVGEINLTFHNLLPGHGYGAQWHPA